MLSETPSSGHRFLCDGGHLMYSETIKKKRGREGGKRKACLFNLAFGRVRMQCTAYV